MNFFTSSVSLVGLVAENAVVWLTVATKLARSRSLFSRECLFRGARDRGRWDGDRLHDMVRDKRLLEP